MATVMLAIMAPVSALAGTKLIAISPIKTLVDKDFVSTIEISKNGYDITDTYQKEGIQVFDVIIKLSKGKFSVDDRNMYLMEDGVFPDENGIVSVEVKNDNMAVIALNADVFNGNNKNGDNEDGLKSCKLDIKARTIEEGDVITTISSTAAGFSTASDIIATAYINDADVNISGPISFKSRYDDPKKIEDIVISNIVSAPDKFEIKLKLKGNYSFLVNRDEELTDGDDALVADDIIQFLNASDVVATYTAIDDEIIFKINRFSNAIKGYLFLVDEDKIIIGDSAIGSSNIGRSYSVSKNVSVYIDGQPVDYYSFITRYYGKSYYVLLYRDATGQVIKIQAYSDKEEAVENENTIDEIYISNLYLEPTKSCDEGDVAKITVSSDCFSPVKLEVAKIPSTNYYSLEEGPTPVIEAGKDYSIDDNYTTNTLGISIKEDSGNIFNTSRKGTFKFPDGIEVIAIIASGVSDEFNYKIDGNVVDVRDYGIGYGDDVVDMKIKFLINADSSFSGNVDVQLSGEFDFKTFTVAKVSKPGIFSYVTDFSPVVIKGEDFLSKIELSRSETSPDIESTDKIGSTDVFDLELHLVNGVFNKKEPVKLGYGVVEYERINNSTLNLKVSTDFFNNGMCKIIFNASAIDAGEVLIKIESNPLPYFKNTTNVVAYAIEKDLIIYAENESGGSGGSHSLSNSSTSKNNAGSLADDTASSEKNDQTENEEKNNTPDSDSQKPQVKMAIGDTNMVIGDRVVAFDTPPYINEDSRSMFPVRVISEAFGAVVDWNGANQTVTVTVDDRVVTMNIGSNVMYINGVPTTMNTAPEITNNRTFIPIRDIANAIGIQNVSWDDKTNTVIIN